MSAQQVAISTEDRRSSAAGALFAVWRFPAGLVLICIGAGLLSVILGPVNYWDLRFYHLYGPWAYLYDRYLYDIWPAQVAGFRYPFVALLLSWLISSAMFEILFMIAFIVV